MTGKFFSYCLVAMALFSAGAHSEDAPKLIEDCYSAGDTDLSESPGQAKISVKVYLDARGFYAEIKNASTDKIIATLVPVADSSKRGFGGWIYSTPASLFNLKNGAANVEVYRTNIDKRNPTGVNAHLTYQNLSVSTDRIKVDRLECNPLGLQ